MKKHFILDKKISFLLILILVLSLMPVISMAGQIDSTTGITYDYGKYVDVNTDGSIDSSSGDGVTGYDDPDQTIIGGANNNLYIDYSKSITETAIPGQYNITLNVETNEELSEIYVPSNVVIIMDVSASMDINKYNNKTRWAIFKKAMQDFVTDFLNKSPENKVSISIFGGKTSISGQNYKTIVHKEIQNWTNSTEAAIASFDKDSASKMRQAYLGDNGDADSGNYGFTNGQAAFRAAYETLTTNSGLDVPNQYTSVIVVTDGEFNRNYNNNNTTQNSTNNNNAAIAESAKISNLKDDDKYKLDNLDLYTLAIDTASDPINQNINTNIKQTFYAKDNNISTIIYNLYKTIQGSVQCWQVTDPMSEYVNYNNGSVKTVKAGTVTYSSDDETLHWNLLEENPTSSGKKEDGTVYYLYSMSYTITVDSDAIDDSDLWSTFVPTNKQTELTYAFVINKILGDTESTLFRIPTVKAVEKVEEGSIEIKKLIKGTVDRSQEFVFEVKSSNGSLVGKSYALYTGSNPISEQKTIGDASTIILKGDQRAVIDDLVAGTEITVTEDPAAHYTPDSSEKKATIDKDEIQNITFTNTYDKPTTLSAVKSSNGDKINGVWVDDEIEYTIVVTNTSQTTATGIIVKDYIPDDTEYTRTENGFAGSDNDGDYVAWYIDCLNPGESSDELKYVVKVTDEFNLDETINNIAYYEITGEIQPESFDELNPENPTNEVVDRPPAPSMNLEKSVDVGNGTTVKAGDELVYTITVNNTARVPLTNVWIRDYVPANTSFVNVLDGGSNTTGLDGKECVEWYITDTILPFDSVSVSFIVKVNETYPDGTVISNIGLGDITEEPGTEDPGTKTNLVENPTEKILGEEATDDPGKVMGEEGFDDVVQPEEQQVLGEEAKTSDDMSTLYYLILLIAAGATAFIFMKRMSRREI